ncbi:MAG: hypothetical protein AAGJ83_10535 [Planctomycetota bacterium]
MVESVSSQPVCISLDARHAIAVEAMRAEESGSWVDFYRRVFGVEGVIRSTLTHPQLRLYQAGPDFVELHERLAHLRSVDTRKLSCEEPVQMVTIRLPRSVHDVLVSESHESNTSMQRLATTKLIVPADERFIPEHRGEIRGRRFGSQNEEQGSVQEKGQEAA